MSKEVFLMENSAMHPPALLLVHGGEPYLVSRSVQSWLQSWQQEDPDVEVKVCRFPMDTAFLQQALVERTLFGERICLVIHASVGSTGAPAKGEVPSWEMLAAGLGARDAEQPCAIVVQGALKTSSPLLRAVLDAGGKVQYVEAFKGREVEQWCAKEASIRGLHLTPEMVHYIVLQSRGNVAQISQELEKCKAYAASRPITMDVLQWLVVGSEEGSLWSIVEALGSPQPARALTVYRQVTEDGKPPQFLISAFSTALHDLLLVGAANKEMKGRKGDIARHCSMPDWKVEKALRQLQYLPLSQLMKWMTDLATLDAGIKRGTVDGDSGLESMLTAMVATCQGNIHRQRR